MKRRRHQISDHALIRYLERVEGMQFDALRQKLAGDIDALVDDMADALGIEGEAGCSAVFKDGVSYVIRDRTVVTVRTGHMGNRVRND